MITKEDLDKLKECSKCKDIQVKKFTSLKDLIDLEKINNDYKRCECGKRPIDIVMSHILKIMIEEKIVPQDATLRHNSPIPLFSIYYSNLNPQFIGQNMLILLHPDFNQKSADRLLNEVSEVKGILKGNPQEITGQFDKNSEIKNFQLLAGDDTQINIMRTLINEKIITEKNQAKTHIEVAMTSEEKLLRLHNYIENNNVKKDIALDGMCGGGILGIYLLKYGFKKVIFNDINTEAIKNLKNNLKLNGITEGYEIYNEAVEDLNIGNIELLVIDAYPNAETSDIIKKYKNIANYIVEI